LIREGIGECRVITQQKTRPETNKRRRSGIILIHGEGWSRSIKINLILQPYVSKQESSIDTRRVDLGNSHNRRLISLQGSVIRGRETLPQLDTTMNELEHGRLPTRAAGRRISIHNGLGRTVGRTRCLACHICIEGECIRRILHNSEE
jgi:hypothetical protein